MAIDETLADKILDNYCKDYCNNPSFERYLMGVNVSKGDYDQLVSDEYNKRSLKLDELCILARLDASTPATVKLQLPKTYQQMPVVYYETRDMAEAYATD